MSNEVSFHEHILPFVIGTLRYFSVADFALLGLVLADPSYRRPGGQEEGSCHRNHFSTNVKYSLPSYHALSL